MMGDLRWTNEKRKLSELKPWPRNPRQIKKDQAERLVDSFDTFGQVETIAIGPEGDIYNGHQRLNVLVQQHGADFEVDVRVASRPLSEKEREKLTVFLHKGAAGEWDFDVLANEFEIDDLLDWGFDEKELIGLDDALEFDEFQGEGDGGGSRISDGTKLRVVIGALMFDIPDNDHNLYKMTQDANADDVSRKLIDIISAGELL